MNQSIITEYSQEGHFLPAHINRPQGHRRLSPIRSNEELYSCKLSQKIKHLQAQIHKNRPALEQIKAQRKFFKRVSDKQKHKISHQNIELMREEYGRELLQLRAEREKFQDLIQIVHEESNIKIQEYVSARSEIDQNHQFLLASLEEVRRENKTYEDLAILKNQTIQQLAHTLQNLHEQIQSKQSVEKKYLEVRTLINQIEENRRLQGH